MTIVAGAYLLLMLVNVTAPTGLSSPRAYFNPDWITLLVVAVVGVTFLLIAREGKAISDHMHDDVPAPASPDTTHA